MIVVDHTNAVLINSVQQNVVNRIQTVLTSNTAAGKSTGVSVILAVLACLATSTTIAAGQMNAAGQMCVRHMGV